MKKLSNMRDVKRKDFSFMRYSCEATVDVTITTGFWFFKKTKVEVKKVFKSKGEIYWRFLDTGAMTPGHEMETLAMVYFYKQGYEE